jgi:ornithine cyclodeaminase
VRPVRRVTVVGRDPRRTRAFADRVSATGLGASVGTAASVAEAELVVCATTAGEPLFDGRMVPDHACVVAVGSHEPHRRELDAHLMGRATVVVEDVATALREAGDVVLAVNAGVRAPETLVSLAELVAGRAGLDPARLDPARPRVFKSVGMSWQDLVTAAEVHRRWRHAGTEERTHG